MGKSKVNLRCRRGCSAQTVTSATLITGDSEVPDIGFALTVKAAERAHEEGYLEDHGT